VSERSLREIAREMRTDKEGAHSYADAYERHLGHLRERAITLLEIGIGGYADPERGGESLRMWKEFFPLARIVGIDIHPKTGIAEDRIVVLQGDQSDPRFLDEVASRYGPFDVIVDDGSHVCAHVIASFMHLFGHLTEGGIYAIEDLQTSYWERTYGGSSGVDRSGTSMTFLQALTDGLNYAELDVPGYVPSALDLSVKSVSFYHNLAFVERGANRELSNRLPPHPRDRTFLALPAKARPAEPYVGPLRRAFRRAIPKPVRAALVRRLRGVAR
jgi:8-demethyl-8-alpha-L-rhamnosyltetracenomycin-C 2'-O-methyltransferase